MSNMSYCRFQNTLNDLHDCYAHMDDSEVKDSASEYRARIRLIELCQRIAAEYGEEKEG